MAARDERDEAAFVVDVDPGGPGRRDATPSEMAVFYRVHAQSRVLEEALRAANVPYQIVGGTKFYERAEVKDALAYLRVLVNPASDVDLARIVNVPARGIGQTTIDRLTALGHGSTTGRSSTRSARVGADRATSGNAAKKKLAAFRRAARRRCASEVAATSAGRAPDRACSRRTGYLEALKKEDTAESDARVENLQRARRLDAATTRPRPRRRARRRRSRASSSA